MFSEGPEEKKDCPDAVRSLDMLMCHPQPTTNPNELEKSQTAQYLEQLTVRMASRVATHDWTHSDFQNLTPDYVAYLDYQDHPHVRGREAFLRHYQAFVEANPDYSFEVISVNADVDEKNGTARVWMLLKVRGHPVNVERESVTVAYWRRKGGRWESYKQTGMRGVGGYL